MSLRFSFRGVRLDRPGSSGNDTKSAYRAGDLIPSSGVYRAIHGDHRLSHDVTLLRGGLFPRCRKCGQSVTFELIESAPAAIEDRDFRVRIYEIPHPELVDDTQHVA